MRCDPGLPLRLELLAQEVRYTANYREADIRMVAEQVQQVIGRTIIVDPRVRAQVTVLSTEPMTADAYYRAFLSMLEVHGFVALESGSTIQIVPDACASGGSRSACSGSPFSRRRSPSSTGSTRRELSSSSCSA